MFNNVDAIDDEAEEEEDDAQVTWTVYNEWDVEAPIPVREDEDDMSALIVRRLMIAFYSHYTASKLTNKNSGLQKLRWRRAGMQNLRR